MSTSPDHHDSRASHTPAQRGPRSRLDGTQAPLVGRRRLVTGIGAGAAALSLSAAGFLDPVAAQLSARAARRQPVLGHRTVDLIERDGLMFKDLSKDGQLHPYEDWRLPAETRARDLVSRMTLAEKAGTMVHPIAFNSETGYYFDEVPPGVPPFFRALRPNITENFVTSMLTAFGTTTSVLVDQHNKIQEIAEGVRLGIPVSLSSDPRNGFTAIQGQTSNPGSFTRWPSSLGFGAINDADLVRQFGDASRQEYLAVGLRVALSPQADIATEPRWSRNNGTFGEDPTVVSRLTAGYIVGFQDGEGGINRGSVVAVTKHFAGYGAQVNGYDSHFEYGQYATFPGGNFSTHVVPFRKAIKVGTGSIMPTYSILQGVTINGRPLEQVGAGFSRQLLTELLRNKLGFGGVILTDWQITDDAPADPNAFGGKPWGVKNLTEQQRFVKAIDAGVDQFGGTSNTENIVAAVNQGQVSQDRLDASVYRIVLQKFQQGLFENPYSDAENAAATVGNARFLAQARRAQRRSVVLLENKNQILPLRRGKKVWARNVEARVLTAYGMSVVSDLSEADVAILRIGTPSSGDHGTDLDFKDDNPDYQAVVAASAAVPTIVAIQLERPAILTNIKDKTAGLLAHFGIEDSCLLDVLIGRVKPTGRLPFQLPSSMQTVVDQRSDVPFDLDDELYAYGHGLTYR